jgi:hypothetical protein
MSLFPNDSNQPKYPIEFRAGMMFRDGNMVRPDKRKGLVFLHQSEGLLHFCWKDRKSGKVEEDWIVFPEDAVFEKVPQCTTGRVFLLKILSAEIKAFFWMQEPKDDKDEIYLKAVNKMINSSMEGFTDFGQDANREQIYQMFQEFSQTPSSTTPTSNASSNTSASSTTNASSSTSSNVQSSPNTQMSQILSGISAMDTTPPGGEPLDKLLTGDNISLLLSQAPLKDRFFSFIPDKANRSAEEWEEVKKSSNFENAIKELNEGLVSGTLADLVVVQLGLDPSAVGPLGGLEALIRAIRAKGSQ